MQEFIGLAYFAEIPAVIFDVQRGGPVDRHADAHAAVRPPRLRLRLPRRHQARRCSSPRTRASASSSRPLAFDLADRLQTPVFVMLDLDIGMNEWLCEPFTWDDSRALRPRQGDDRRGARGRHATSAATSTSTATASPTARYPAPTRPAAPTSPAAPRATAMPRYTEEGAGLRRQHAAAAAQVRDREGAGARAGRRGRAPQPTRHGVIYFGSTAAADGRGAGRARGRRASTSTRCACAPSRSADDGGRLHRRARAGVRGRAEPRRASCARCWSTSAAIDPARLVPVLHYDGTPITARFIVDGDRRSRLRAMPRPEETVPHDLPRQAQAPPPDAADERSSASPTATTRARSRRCAPAAATTRSRAAIIQACFELDLEPHRVAKLSGIGCSSKTPDLLPGQLRTASTPCTAACRRC